jgi:hypothetical protein
MKNYARGWTDCFWAVSPARNYIDGVRFYAGWLAGCEEKEGVLNGREKMLGCEFEFDPECFSGMGDNVSFFLLPFFFLKEIRPCV